MRFSKTTPTSLGKKPPVTPPARIHMYLTRWLDRPPHRNYQKTMLQDVEWQNDLTIAVHGGKSSDNPLSSFWPILDLRKVVTNGSLSAVVYECYLDARRKGYEAFGVMDDDAFYDYPQSALDKACEVLFQKGAGCCGPISPYRFMSRYKNSDTSLGGEDGVWPLEQSPWVTYGSQFYRIDVLDKMPNLDKVCGRMQFRIDTILWLMISAMGYPTMEFHAGGYKHTLSNSKTAAYDKEWHRRRMIQSYRDFVSIIDYFTLFIADEFTRIRYIDEARKEWKNELNYTYQRMRETWQPDWFPNVRTPEELCTAIRKREPNESVVD